MRCRTNLFTRVLCLIHHNPPGYPALFRLHLLPRLFDEVHRHMHIRHYSLRTEKIYIGWIRRFILVNLKRHPREMGANYQAGLGYSDTRSGGG